MQTARHISRQPSPEPMHINPTEFYERYCSVPDGAEISNDVDDDDRASLGNVELNFEFEVPLAAKQSQHELSD